MVDNQLDLGLDLARPLEMNGMAESQAGHAIALSRRCECHCKSRATASAKRLGAR